MNRQRITIIGGGAVGGATAYFLSLLNRPQPRFEITVIERDLSYTRASSALSAGSVRQQFSVPLHVQMSLFGFEFLRDIAQHLAVSGQPTPDIQLCERGYLFLATAQGRSILQDNVSLQRQQGALVDWVEPAELHAHYPWMNTTDLACASYGAAHEGWFDGYALVQALRQKNQSLGVRYVHAQATGLHMQADTVTAVHTEHTTLPSDVVINATGPWAAQVAAWAGIPLPVRARRRTVFVVSTPTPIDHCPMVIDPSGLWFRPEGSASTPQRHFIAGISPAAHEADEDNLPLEPNLHLFESHIWPQMAHRVPAFEALRMERAWAGYYEVNTLDHNAIIGTHPSVTNLYFANGFSGHGLQHAPAAGRALAELISTDRFQTLDMSPLGFARVLRQEPLLERNII